MIEQLQPNWVTALCRGLRRRCPRCGRGRLFDGWYGLRQECTTCALEFEPADGDTWGFMYLTTAGLTGVLILAMLLIRPPTIWIGQVGLAAAVVVLILGTLPHRKGLAIAVDYLANRQWGVADEDDA